MKNVILVLTNSEDGEHSSIVIEKLEKKGEEVFRFDVDKITRKEAKIYFSADPTQFNFVIECSGRKLNFQNVKSVWYRRPNKFDFEITDPIQRQFAEKELSAFLDGLWLSVEGAFWLNDFRNLEIARSKILQLKIAREIGFNIPRTIVTNDPMAVRELFAECDDGVIFKTLKQSFIKKSGKGFNIPTTLLNGHHFNKLNLIEGLPSLFQEYIDKQYELRITIVGNEIFPVLIDSQNNSLTVVDWRRPEVIDKIKYVPVCLPDNISSFCFLLMERLGLYFGAIDLVVNKKGRYFFLEINPNGQWYWLEHLCGIGVSDAIANALISVGDRKERR